MKRLMILVGLLSTLAFAGSAAPVKVTGVNGVFTFTNVTKKTIVLVAGNIGQTMFAHEFLFKKAGFPAGGTFELNTAGDNVTGTPTVTFVQFEDGSTFGNRDDVAAQEALTMRNQSLSKLGLFDATDPRYSGASTGTAMAMDQDRVAAATARRGIWSF